MVHFTQQVTYRLLLSGTHWLAFGIPKCLSVDTFWLTTPPLTTNLLYLDHRCLHLFHSLFFYWNAITQLITNTRISLAF